MATATLQRIEREIELLPVGDQIWLMERLAVQIRLRYPVPIALSGADLAAMAADSDIRRELQAIAAEFAVTELDGLDVAP